MLEALEESGEIVTDPQIQQKLYERWQKRVEETKGVVQSDELDVEEIKLDSFDIINDDAF